MITVESALENLKQCLNKLNIEYSVLSAEPNIQINTYRDSVQIECWFDSVKQLYGFNMIQGGIKAYADITQFEHYFSTYLYINTVFIPNAKKVADEFEKVIGVDSLYKSFRGSDNSGYIAIFNILSDNSKELSVTKANKDGEYYIKLNEIETGKILKQALYRVDEVGNVDFIPDINYYLDKLGERYAEDNSITINRIGASEFEFKYSDMTVKALVTFDDNSIVYLVHYVNEDLAESQKIEILDPFDLSELHQISLGFIKPMEVNQLQVETESFFEEGVSGENTQIEEDDTDEKSNSHKPSTFVESENTEINTPDTHIEEKEEDTLEDEVQSDEEQEDISEDEAQLEEEPEEVVKEEVEKEGTTLDNDIVTIIDTVKLIEIDGEVSLVRFDCGQTIYDMDIDKAKSLGIPVHNIVEIDKKYIKRGILATDDERKRRVFAEDITSNDLKCETLVDVLFD